MSWNCIVSQYIYYTVDVSIGCKCSKATQTNLDIHGEIQFKRLSKTTDLSNSQ